MLTLKDVSLEDETVPKGKNLKMDQNIEKDYKYINKCAVCGFCLSYCEDNDKN